MRPDVKVKTGTEGRSGPAGAGPPGPDSEEGPGTRREEGREGWTRTVPVTVTVAVTVTVTDGPCGTDGLGRRTDRDGRTRRTRTEALKDSDLEPASDSESEGVYDPLGEFING